MLATEVNVHDLTDIFIRFREVIGESFWIKRVKAIDSEIRGYPFLKEYLQQENSLAFALSEWSRLIIKHGIIPRSARLKRSLYPAIAFMVQALSFIDSASGNQRKSFIRRVQSSFRNPDDLRALMFEITVATQFVKNGKSLIWPEVKAVGSPDIIIEDLGSVGLQVECKSISRDKGKKIHTREALEFFNLLRPGLKRMLTGCTDKTGVSVVVSVPDRLPRSHKEKEVLAKEILNGTQTFTSQTLCDGIELKISNFDLSLLNNEDINSNNDSTRKLVDLLTGTENCEAMFISSSGKVMLVALKSKSEDSVLGYTFETLRQSSKTQVSKERPAVYMVEFNGVNSEELLEIAKHDFNSDNQPTGLRLAVSEFLSSLDRPYIVGIVFLSRGEVRQTGEGTYSEGGAAYYFPVKESTFWHNDFDMLFPVEMSQI